MADVKGATPEAKRQRESIKQAITQTEKQKEAAEQNVKIMLEQNKVLFDASRKAGTFTQNLKDFSNGADLSVNSLGILTKESIEQAGAGSDLYRQYR